MQSPRPVEIPQVFTSTSEALSSQTSLLSRGRWYVRAFGVVFLVASAALLRLWLDRTFGLTLHYLTYFPAVFLAAQIFGTIEGFFATTASVIIATQPFGEGALAHLTLADKASVFILVLSGIALSILAGALRSRAEQLQQALNELQASREKITVEQHRLHETTEKFHTIVESSDEAITTIDMSGILNSWNKGAEAMFGYTAEEILGRPFRKLLPQEPEADAEAREILTTLARGETVEKLGTQRTAKNGRLLHVNLIVTPVRDAHGNLVGASAVTRDISENVKLQKELKTSRERASDDRRRLHEAATRFDTVLAVTDEAIIGKDTSGVITSWNKGAELIFGHTADEMIGHPIQRLLPGGREHEEDEILACILRGEVVEKRDTQRIDKNGQIIHLNITVSPIRDAQGNIIGATKVARNITEQLKLQRQLQQSQKMEAIGQLAGGIAHDFNNLLAIIQGALELQLPTLTGNEEASRRWGVASRAARRGAELTRHLLAFSSKEHFKFASTDLNHSVRNTLEMAQRLIGPDIKVHLNMEKSISRILVDPAGLESAVLNLAINARDAMMPRGGTLTVSTRTAELDESFTATLTGPIRAGAYACISVTDTGSGMSPEILDRACEPFFTTKERGRGTGLGLSMVYGFVKHSGGGIRIYSEVGYGTTITFYLPFEASGNTAATGAHSASEKNAETRRTGRILIVDDEADLLEISVCYLTARGYTALSAHDGKEALDLLKKYGPVDVLITDIVMGGGMDGMELAKSVHRLYPQTRIIYSSGFPADTLSTRSLPPADSLVLQKPYRLAELGASVEQALGIRQILTAAAPMHPSPAAEEGFTAPTSPASHS